MWKNEKNFKNLKPNFKKLECFGFQEEENCYSYSEKVLNESFCVNVCVCKSGETAFEVVDCDTLEEYVMAYLEDSQGAFVGNVRTALNEVLERVINECYESNVFKNFQSKQIINYVYEKFGAVPEFLWEGTPNNAVFRVGPNKKWYGALLSVNSTKLGLPYEREEEILNLKAMPCDVSSLVNKEGFLPAYHMNKKHWYTVVLNGSVPIDEIYSRIDESYRLIVTNK